MRVSVQLQRALNYTRRWIRVLFRTFRVMTRKKDLFILMNEFEQESHKCSSQNRARQTFVLIKLKLCYLFLKWPIVSLDKTLIHRLVSFKASFEAALKLSFGSWTVWYPMKSIIWKKSWNVSFSFRLKKERHGHLGWHGGEYISSKSFFLKSELLL